MTINERINKKLKPWGLTVEDLTEEELAEAEKIIEEKEALEEAGKKGE